jgi:hypothetical protein
MSNEVNCWRALASRLGIEVTAPVTVQVGDESATFAALLPQFGGRKGMIADPDWEAIDPHADALLRLGYGFSAIEIGSDPDDESTKEVLRDWGWTVSEPMPDWW